MAHRLAEQAEADLDDIWWRIANESGSVAIAQDVVACITERFHLLARPPESGRARDEDLGPGRRSFPVKSYIIVYTVVDGDVLILRVAHGSRDLKSWMGR
jgi:toxin ParE1/3/4